MTNMMQHFLDLDREYDMFPSGCAVLCAVSGGADSMCLLHLLVGLGAERGFTVTAAHLNHRHREEESNRDEDFVKAWCGENGVPCVTAALDVPALLAERGGCFEDVARDVRYNFLHRTAAERGCELLATAHNADDNAETLLLHLVRGTGLRGLAGIAPRRDNLVRPLLTTTRAEILVYLETHGVPHIEDSTNALPVHTRNRIRGEVMPLLRSLNPNLIEGMAATARWLRTDNDYLNAQALRACGAARWAEDNLVIKASVVAELPDAVAPRAARRLVEMMGDGKVNLSASHITAIVDLARGDDPSAVAMLPGGLLVQRVYSELLLTTQGDALPPFDPVALTAGKNSIPGTHWTVTLSAVWSGLTARPRQQGDEITLRARGTKTVKKLFIDEKVPRRFRERIPVVADENGVLAVAGFGVNMAHPNFEQTEISFENGKEDYL